MSAGMPRAVIQAEPANSPSQDLGDPGCSTCFREANPSRGSSDSDSTRYGPAFRLGDKRRVVDIVIDPTPKCRSVANCRASLSDRNLTDALVLPLHAGRR
jgi:hypothetical protein